MNFRRMALPLAGGLVGITAVASAFTPVLSNIVPVAHILPVHSGLLSTPSIKLPNIPDILPSPDLSGALSGVGGAGGGAIVSGKTPLGSANGFADFGAAGSVAGSVQDSIKGVQGTLGSTIGQVKGTVKSTLDTALTTVGGVVGQVKGTVGGVVTTANGLVKSLDDLGLSAKVCPSASGGADAGASSSTPAANAGANAGAGAAGCAGASISTP
jgi:hypothetical protein